jgi:hypothetical protein
LNVRFTNFGVSAEYLGVSRQGSWRRDVQALSPHSQWKEAARTTRSAVERTVDLLQRMNGMLVPAVEEVKHFRDVDTGAQPQQSDQRR